MSTPLERITALVSDQLTDGGEFTSTPLLTLEEFFEGNETEGSILGEGTAPISAQDAYDVFAEIRDRTDVADVRIALTSFDDPEWPSSDTVLLETLAAPEEVRSWFDVGVEPDEVDPLAPDDDLVPIARDLGMDPERILVLWWD